MNDEKLNQYYTTEINKQKALERLKQDEQFRKDIENLRANQEKLDSRYNKLAADLKGKTDKEIAKDKEGFEKLKHEYIKMGSDAEKNRMELKRKEKEYEEFKEKNKAAQDFEATPADVNRTSDILEYGEKAVAAGRTQNRYRTEHLPQQRDNAFTQLKKALPKKQVNEDNESNDNER
jgi:hypothetical protein